MRKLLAYSILYSPIVLSIILLLFGNIQIKIALICIIAMLVLAFMVAYGVDWALTEIKK
jgi:uncharacterized membrane protein